MRSGSSRGAEPRRGPASAPPADPRTRVALHRLERLAYLLDARYRLPGTRFRFGWDGIVGLVPGIGDVATSALSAYIVYEAWRLGTPRGTLARMLGNLGFDGLVGAVPILGDLFDIGYKANLRNVRLLHRHLSAHAAGQGVPAAARPAASARS